ncbi:hypothetical protein RIR_jg9203.t1 [Rhizophagus irregularis DAOM 181602=DAOM 197198]|uniref:Uncharacterized protein n=1 Tax=Rhizophagus irregularis (strain DAOM 181602 / DAOM 197198 / MUCL 43194) TaxID=747089 RepID=U9U788_RHIID|nr:hypothetical protein RIR_jg9203.t1 [Rhizophagus irregularis DAOM 181602=DAOM 197198]
MSAVVKTRTKQFITKGREYHWNVVFHLTHCLAATLRYTNDQANDLPLLKIYVIPELHTVPCNSIPFKSLFGRSYKENGNQSNDIIILNYVNHYETNHQNRQNAKSRSNN